MRTRAPGTIDTATPSKVPSFRGDICVAGRRECNLVDVFCQFSALMANVRIDDEGPAYVSQQRSECYGVCFAGNLDVRRGALLLFHRSGRTSFQIPPNQKETRTA